MKRILILLLLPAFMTGAEAQELQTLTEGVIRYSVSLGPVNGTTGFTEHAGTYTITIKGKQVRKELSMNSGYTNVILLNSNTNTAYSLQSGSGQKYAIQLSMADLQAKARPYLGYKMADPTGNSTIAGWPCQMTTVTYKDGTTSALYFTTAWRTDDTTLFDRFPGIQRIPLSFEYRNEEGIAMHFSAEKLESVPVESAVFRVPPDFPVISNAEYQNRKR